MIHEGVALIFNSTMRLLSLLYGQAGAPRTLITGGLGQLGRGLAKALRYKGNGEKFMGFVKDLISILFLYPFRDKYGHENVILSDVIKCPDATGEKRFYVTSQSDFDACSQAL